MSKRIFLYICSLLLCIGLAAPAYGWNDIGHMTVAFLAYQQLSPTARARVNDLLKKNPKHDEWMQSLPASASPEDKDMMIFVIAATWADQIKRDHDYTADGSAHGDNPEGSENPTQNTGYDDKKMHKYWHFIDTPFSQDGSALPDTPSPNAQTQIAAFRAVLASDSSDDLKSYDLSWLLHLVGDVHQPLHCATRVSATAPDGDAGGNRVKLSCSGCSSELHAFWDGLLGQSRPSLVEEVNSVIRSAPNLPDADATLAAKSKEQDWVDESFQEAKQAVYKIPIGRGQGPFQLTTAYKTVAKRLAIQRVTLAGARLANLLNNELR